jgi:hypothetical protein
MKVILLFNRLEGINETSTFSHLYLKVKLKINSAVKILFLPNFRIGKYCYWKNQYIWNDTHA